MTRDRLTLFAGVGALGFVLGALIDRTATADDPIARADAHLADAAAVAHLCEHRARRATRNGLGGTTRGTAA